MGIQRTQARAGARAGRMPAGEQAYRSVLDTEVQTIFVGQRPDGYSAPARVVAVLGERVPEHAGQAEVFLDRTPFYAEGGGQVGDTGTIVTETGTALVYDPRPPFPALPRHRATVTGELFAGQEALATIDGVRRGCARRNHTGTHLLHAALRTVLGDHVRQQGSLVAPDRLRSTSPPWQRGSRGAGRGGRPGQRRRAHRRRGDGGGDHQGPGRSHGGTGLLRDKYGERVRVVRAGPHSIELCGGTHVGALGMIGPITVVSEASIGSNTRRMEAVTGASAFDRIVAREGLLAEAAALLRTEPEHVPEAIDRLLERQRAAERSLEQAHSRELRAEASGWPRPPPTASWSPVRRADPDLLRDLAQTTRTTGGFRAVVLGGVPTGSRPRWPSPPTRRPAPVDAGALVKQIAPLLGGGGGGSPAMAVAGGKDRAVSTGPSTRPAASLPRRDRP